MHGSLPLLRYEFDLQHLEDRSSNYILIHKKPSITLLYRQLLTVDQAIFQPDAFSNFKSSYLAKPLA